MQGYLYSVFSLAAIVVHLITNFDLLFRRSVTTGLERLYRGFLLGSLFYYVADGAWGLFAGLGWTRVLYVDTIFFFLSMPVFVFMWCRLVINYLKFGKWTAGILTSAGYALLAFNVVMLTANFFNNCLFYFDEHGKYLLGNQRSLAFDVLIVYLVLTAIIVFSKALGSKEAERRRNMMVFLFCITITVAVLLQIIWPLTPVTALGCLIGNCFFHVFVVNEQTERRANELETALERARAAERSRSLFFSIVSHDIRTPLNAIIGYSQLIRKGIRNPDELDEALRSIEESGTTLLELVNDFFTLAKMDSGQMELHAEPVRLGKLTDDVFATFRMAAAQKDIKLINRTIDVPTVLLDPHRFRQILFNLIGNAIKFTDQGSVTVAASYSNTDLAVSVSDTGCGIPADMQTRIFDPLVQVQDPSHEIAKASGSGLGLSICQRLVKAMGGELSVESAVGKGSTFKVRISGIVADETKIELATAKPAVGLNSLPRHVLIVDDSAVNRAVLTALLKKIGVTAIDQACDGEAALTRLESAIKEANPYDFVISDFWMPNMNGMELIEKLRADSRFTRLPVFALTADIEFKSDARASLFTGTLLKPLTYDKLVGVLSSI